NKNGSATITLTLTDNGTPMPALTATSSFVLTVVAVPDLTGTLTIASNLSGVASSYSANVYGRTMKFTGLTVDEALTTFEICLGTAAGSCDVATWVEAVGYTTSGSAPTVTLGGTYTLKSATGGAQTFTLTPSCGTTTNYYYSVRATNNSSRTSNVLSTPAWSFWEPTCLGAGTLSQWLDASEPSTITIVTGVSNWTDKSGNARTVTQATTAKQPAYSASGLAAGYPGLTFNGASSSLMRAAFVYAQGASSIFTVIKATASTGKYVFSEARSVTTNNFYCPLVTSATNTITGQITNDVATAVLASPTTSTPFFDGTIRIAMAEDTGSTYFTYSNGTAQSQATTSYVRGTNTIDLYRLGSKLIKNVESAWFAGTIGEFIVTNGTLTTTQRQKLEGYSAHKWGVSANLPGAHPYLSAPP
ncbi:MAG: hypothetical protein H7177_06765, partial [Rhizobacter sp.]|nr:hypothetical protein [Bacteriovorax sp.]